jgi:multidrug resistance efflux pump
MRKKLKIGVICVVGLVLLIVGGRCRRARTSVPTEAVTTGPLTVVSTYEGTIQSRRIESISSRFNGRTTITWMVPEGTYVDEDSVLARFESSAVQRDLIKLESEFVLAESEHESLKRAKLPLELKELEVDVLEMRTTYEMERQYLADVGELVEDGLMSDGQLKEQELKVEKIKQQLATIEQKLELTKEHLHPAIIRRAEASLEAAGHALSQARGQFSNAVVRAPIAGFVVYKSLHVGTEFRVARVGDSIYENQPFMMIPDMSNLVVDCYVPEAELSRVETGAEVVVVPLAYPDISLRGRIETVSSMAQPMSWMPSWQKYFHVVIALETMDPKLRPGMSAHATVLSYHNEEAVLVPRLAVFWRANVPHCKVMGKVGGCKIREIAVGKANETHYEVLNNLKPGVMVVLE